MTVAHDYKEARELAKSIAESFAVPSFYVDLNREREISRRILDSDPILNKSRQIVQEKDEHFGHGLSHSEKVATDAGAIVQNEWKQMNVGAEHAERTVLLVQIASLFHDIKRRVPEHARQSAHVAAEILAGFPLEDFEREWIVRAIENHEAFVEPTPLDDAHGQLLSDALYDADKFRWGPENFTDTLWEMVSREEIPIRLLIAHFPRGMQGVRRISNTFRSETGIRYGPEFIDLGLAIGNRLYQELMKRFPAEES